ncbi:methyltransferase domain-containing protein [Singulisphaera sp. PoT]|uniref:methyltransferase domain-containing protein n=1 Tax=Singulisphaera sp. PoT TaxID=3411797 RepID=UPI003BF58799
MPSVETGTIVDGVRCESLMGLTYPDESFELVLTSETLEHIPDLGVALAEIRRVLVPRGLHIFTIPWLPTVASTFARASMTSDGSIAHELPLIHHPGGDVGYPVFTEFGLDLPQILEGAGFDTKVVFGPPSEVDVAQVFVCRKRG